MTDSRFLGVCIVIAAVILAVAIVWHGGRAADAVRLQAQLTAPEIGRYQFAPSNPPGVIWVIDTTTGKVKTQGG